VSWVARAKTFAWERSGRKPYAYGYHAARWYAIDEGIDASDGRYDRRDAGLDERVVEYPWVFHRVRALKTPGSRVLDAGSVLNHERILERWRREHCPPVSIVTLAHEGRADVSDDVRYEFGDLRKLPYRDEWFSTVLCISTIEHIGFDTTIYGVSEVAAKDAAREATQAMQELRRVTTPGGTLLLSVPFGKRSSRGWLRVLDGDDLDQLTETAGWSLSQTRYFRAMREGWRETTRDEARDAGYNEPHSRPGTRSAPEWVAAAEAVALSELQRT
jgi:SAM-dependent methyltransferase